MNKNSYAKQYKYQRIAEDIKIDIFSNRMKGNTPLPSIREYAKKYCVNPNTISNALNLLKNENIIYTYRTKGYFVVENIEDRRYALAQKEICNLINILYKIGIDKQSLLNILLKPPQIIEPVKTIKAGDNMGK